MKNEPDVVEVEAVEIVPSQNPIEALTRGEIDIQIATAHRFPRSIQRFREEAMSMVTNDEDTAASCFYVLPRGGKSIEGPSIRLAEIAKACYGNIRTGSRVVNIGDTTVTAQGVAHDLEKNVATSTEVVRRITDKYGKRYNEDMIAVTLAAACAIAQRNAIYGVVPRVYINQLFAAAKQVAVGDATTLTARRDKMLTHFAKMGVTDTMVLDVIGKAGIDDINLTDLETLIGVSTAIKDGYTTIDQVFNRPVEDDGMTKTERLAGIIGGHKKEKAKPGKAKAEYTGDGLFPSPAVEV